MSQIWANLLKNETKFPLMCQNSFRFRKSYEKKLIYLSDAIYIYVLNLISKYTLIYSDWAIFHTQILKLNIG